MKWIKNIKNIIFLKKIEKINIYIYKNKKNEDRQNKNRKNKNIENKKVTSF
jgi:hypothetical protein